MKRMMIGAAAAVAAFAATPALAGSLNIGLFAPAPVVYQPAPVVYHQPPVAYYPPVQHVYYAPPRPVYHSHRHWARDDRRWDRNRFQVSYWDGDRRDYRR